MSTKTYPVVRTTTLARQLNRTTGGGDALLQRMTGSVTRTGSPTKQPGVNLRPRPNSVIGMRHSKSIDSGRGMELVKQFTGSSTSTKFDG